ncbi:NAD(P)H-binding protein [Amycolatopsis sp. NPDC051071]|uniref:SDR family oxidoreductase n=1 Tax=Amycolatopsis sp. NPDC051071 TaxID=3154637 RepID=UPI00341ACD71
MILVTGGTGNVGANVVSQLLDAGEKVRVLTRHPSNCSFPDQVEVVPGDLTRPTTLPAALTGVERAFLFPVFDGGRRIPRSSQGSPGKPAFSMSEPPRTFRTVDQLKSTVRKRGCWCPRSVESFSPEYRE